jgi:F-type H+-transporting ATPase subunit c
MTTLTFFTALDTVDIRLTCFRLVGAGLATISLVGSGVGVGFVFGSFLTALSRNPQIKDELFRYAILGFALTEAVGLLGLMMTFLILFM